MEYSLKDTRDKSYGYFDDERREYVITRPDTPRPWMNYVGHEKYCLRFSQTGGGDSFHRFPRVNMVTFSHYDDCPEFYDDKPGRWIYVKDTESKALWTINWQPVQKEFERYRCRHGMGYSRIESKTNGIEGTLRVFVPLDEPVEIWSVKLTNHRSTVAKLDISGFVEWFLTDNISKGGYVCGNHARYDSSENMIYTWLSKPLMPEQNYAAFMASDFNPDGYEVSRRSFLGPYGGYHQPKAVVDGMCCGKEADYEPMVGVLQKYIEIPPGQSFDFQILVGSVNDKNHAIQLKNKFLKKEIIEQEFVKVNQYWDKRLGTTEVQTPCHSFDHLVNTWLKYQVHHTSHWVRPGGDKGFRDMCQDAENILAFDAPRSKRILLEAMKYQYESGKAVRQWPQQPEGELDTRDYRDSPVWLAYSVCEYIKETGDVEFLENKVPYLDNGEDTVYLHAQRAVECLYADRGEHGLSHIGCGDWNDGLDEVGLKGRGESVWLTIALVKALNDIAELAEHIGDEDTQHNYLKKANELTKIINDVAWDGDWYVRAFADDGEVIGSNTCEEGKIFLLPQAWAMIAGISTKEQNRRMIKAIEEMLLLDYGPMVMAPVYTRNQKGIGKIVYRPGFSEAGSVYLHAASFLIAGYCAIGEADRAFDIWQRICPTNPKNPSDISWAEPYVFSNFYMGPAAVCPGRSLYGWLTATGGWMLKNGLSRICGIQPGYQGLDIKPSLPSCWDKISVKRVFRGTTFNIEISRGINNKWVINQKECALPIKNVEKKTLCSKSDRCGDFE